MKVGRFATQLKYSLLGAFVLAGLWPVAGVGARRPDQGGEPRSTTMEQIRGSSRALLSESSANRRSASATCAVAEAEGYGLLFGCVSGADAGAMGMHFVNGVADWR